MEPSVAINPVARLVTIVPDTGFFTITYDQLGNCYGIVFKRSSEFGAVDFKITVIGRVLSNTNRRQFVKVPLP